MVSFSERRKQAGGVNSLGTEKQKAVSKKADFLETVIGQFPGEGALGAFLYLHSAGMPSLELTTHSVPCFLGEDHCTLRPSKPGLKQGTA